jgi:hypothetical protein
MKAFSIFLSDLLIFSGALIVATLSITTGVAMFCAVGGIIGAAIK